MHVEAELRSAQGEEGVKHAARGAGPPTIDRRGDEELVRRRARRRTHERIDVGVAADHAMKDDRVGGPEGGGLSDEIADAAVHPALEAPPREELAGRVLVSGRQFDVRRARRAGAKELELDRAHAAADLEHRPARDPALAQRAHDGAGLAVQPATAVRPRVVRSARLVEDVVEVAWAAALGHERRVAAERLDSGRFHDPGEGPSTCPYAVPPAARSHAAPPARVMPPVFSTSSNGGKLDRSAADASGRWQAIRAIATPSISDRRAAVCGSHRTAGSTGRTSPTASSSAHRWVRSRSRAPIRT